MRQSEAELAGWRLKPFPTGSDQRVAQRGELRVQFSVLNRRRLLIGAAALTTGGLLSGQAAASDSGIVKAALRAPRKARHLALHSSHLGEKVAVDYWIDGRYQNDALHAISSLMRDRRSDEVTAMSPKLMDLLYLIRHQLDAQAPVEIVCGYRSPKTNAKLAKRSSGVAKNSYHMRGMAVDIRIQGCSPRQVQKAALALKAGGVGYYPKSGFVHVDVGPVRSW